MTRQPSTDAVHLLYRPAVHLPYSLDLTVRTPAVHCRTPS